MPSKRNIAVPAKAKTANVPAASKKPVITKPVPPAALLSGVIAAHTAQTAAIAKASAAKPVTKPVNAPDTQPRGLTRDAVGIVRYATNFNQYSSRDEAYLAFFGNVMRANGGSATLRQIHDAGITRSGMPDRKRYNPNYTGSGKATDVGAINRLAKAGYISRSTDGNTLTATKLALASKAYSGGK